MAMPSPRSIWSLLEPIHAVTYFTPQARAAHEAVGLRGFWRGYVAMRAAPLGPAGLGPVTAVFYNFSPSFLARSLPEVWDIVSPAQALAVRTEGATASLRAYLPDLLDESRIDGVLGTLRGLASRTGWAGRPLGAANAALPWPDKPVEALWHAATVLREHRGDGHVAVLSAEGVDGVEAHVLRDAEEGNRASIMAIRGWTDVEWDDGVARLAARGLLAPAGGLTAEGAALRAHIEQRTDDLAAAPYRDVDPAELVALADVLRPLARGLATSAVPYPNPTGAPAP
jgi:hypothetical protein